MVAIMKQKKKKFVSDLQRGIGCGLLQVAPSYRAIPSVMKRGVVFLERGQLSSILLSQCIKNLPDNRGMAFGWSVLIRGV
jgi:hypothetical protein